jgi:hypothetical protein
MMLAMAILQTEYPPRRSLGKNQTDTREHDSGPCTGVQSTRAEDSSLVIFNGACTRAMIMHKADVKGVLWHSRWMRQSMKKWKKP